ncbi:MFS transporter [Rhodopseudomonas sp. NSM]|uniref:MFS transporter n=1 Tax=Rhodopseudomonas sp. NSM TaxID=3457630 RepID=UPI0040356E9A
MSTARIVESGPVSTGGIGPRPLFAVGAVLMGSFLSNFDSRLFAIALPDLRGAQSLSFDQGAWLSTAATASQIFIAPAVAWMATAFGLRRVLGLPSLVYAVVSLLIPLVHSYELMMALSVVHGLLLGIFVPATLLIIFRNLPLRWWLPAISIYAIRVGFSLNFGISVVGFYVDQIGWQWLYWQDALIAPLLGLFVYLGTPPEPVNTPLVKRADWGGMLLLGSGMALIYAGLDQGNRLNWFGSGTVVACLGCGAALVAGFFVNERVVAQPWAHANVLFSRNIGFALLIILLFSLTSLSNSLLAPDFLASVAGLRPEQSGQLFLVYAVLPMLLWVPLSVWLIRRIDVRLVLIAGLAAFCAAGLLGTRLTHAWALGDFVPMVLLQSFGQAFTLLPIVIITLSNSDPQRATAFAAYIQVARLGGAELSVSLMTTWLRVREQLYSNLLGLHVSKGDPLVSGVLSDLTRHFDGAGSGEARQRAVSTLAQIVQREANTLSFIDGFWLAAWFGVAALLCAACIRGAPPGPFTPRGG